MSYGRVLRRATHRSRSVAAGIVAILLMAAAIWALVEIILYALGKPALILPAHTAWVGLLDPAGLSAPWVLGAGLGFVLVGIVLIVLALAPGRLPRRTWVTDTAAFIVDDAVVASYAAARAAQTASVPTDAVTAEVSKRRLSVTITPLAGQAVDVERVKEDLAGYLSGAPWHPALTVKVQLASKAVVAK